MEMENESKELDKIRLYGFNMEPPTNSTSATAISTTAENIDKTENDNNNDISNIISQDTDPRQAFEEFMQSPETAFVESQRHDNRVRPMPMPTVPPQNQVRPMPMPTVPPQNQVRPMPMPTVPPQPQPPQNFPRSGSAPRSAPPNYIPQTAPNLRAVDPGAINGCLYNNTFIWLTNGRSFWYYPTFVGRRSVSGFRWTGRGWVFMGFDLNLVEAFFCGGRGGR
ncbi:MAG: hypothetical protein FWD01_02810 [Defluviitaleaceae bacterium]|nr:hypothetical protein [Defluviitaleaceae bacterium]